MLHGDTSVLLSVPPGLPGNDWNPKKMPYSLYPPRRGRGAPPAASALMVLSFGFMVFLPYVWIHFNLFSKSKSRRRTVVSNCAPSAVPTLPRLPKNTKHERTWQWFKVRMYRKKKKKSYESPSSLEIKLYGDLNSWSFSASISALPEHVQRGFVKALLFISLPVSGLLNVGG